MEFLKQNLLFTTTQMTVPANNTGTMSYVFDRNVSLPFTSVGYNSTSTLVMGITFSPAVNITHVLLQNHNLKDFRIYYNSVTANSIAVETTNSFTYSYFSIPTATSVLSIDIQMNSAMTAGSEKIIGELIISERRLQFERNPSVADWKPSLRRKQIIHEMPDGGVRVYNIRDKFQSKLKWNFITSTFHSNLNTVFTEANPLYFVPFPTTTAWPGEAYEVLWTGDFDFKHGDNAKAAGYTGNMEIRQTAGG